MPFLAGQKLRAAALNRLGAFVGRNRRTTNSAGSGTIVRILSTSAPVVAGRTYRVTCHGEVYAVTVPATSQNELRYTTDGSEPTTTSAILARALVDHRVAATPDSCTIIGLFPCTSSGTLKVALCATRVIGSGNVVWSADATFPTHITIEDVGDTVSTTGTVY